MCVFNMETNKCYVFSLHLSYSDPRVVIIEGSTDAATWVELYNIEDDILFKTRTESTELLLSNNDTEYKYYRITFRPKDNMSKYYLGHYGLIPSYTRTCTSNIHLAITGEYVRPYETLAPTEAPTSSPTTVPTDAPGFEMTNSNIKTAVDLWTSDRSSALATYGHISTWDVSRVTSMKDLFRDKKTFNDDIGGWYVAHVTTMHQMFWPAHEFNQNLSTWNVSRLTTMTNMFHTAKSFDQDTSEWDVSSVTTLHATFANTEAFNQNLSAWNVSRVTSM